MSQMDVCETSLETCDIIEAVVQADARIAELTAHKFSAPPDFVDRFLPTRRDLELVNLAMSARAAFGVSFPEAASAAVLSIPPPSKGYFSAVAYHHELGAGLPVSRAEVLAGGLRALQPDSRLGVYTGISSLVKMADASCPLHLPMLDFHVPCSPEALELVLEVLHQISPCHGWVLNSGKSYHFVGQEVVSSSALMRFLAKAVLFAPVTDRNWIAHQICEQHCTLRLFDNPRTGAGPPKVACRFTRLWSSLLSSSSRLRREARPKFDSWRGGRRESIAIFPFRSLVGQKIVW